MIAPTTSVRFIMICANPETPNTPLAFKAPFMSTTILTKIMYGNMIWVREVVSSCAAGSINPGAITETNSLEKIIPSNETNPVASVKRETTSRSSNFAFPDFMLSANTGTKAEERAPSPKTLLKRFGILKATKYESAIQLVPKRRAISSSRTKPRIRLIRVRIPTINVPLRSDTLGMIIKKV